MRETKGTDYAEMLLSVNREDKEDKENVHNYT